MDPQQQFFQALSALRSGDLDRCETICASLLAINPREVNTLRLRGQLLERRGEMAAAAAACVVALHLSTGVCVRVQASLGRAGTWHVVSLLILLRRRAVDPPPDRVAAAGGCCRGGH